jgi:uncharacterized membrane protein
MVARISTVVLVLAAVAGLVFASLSTSDFVQHLDRQVHSLHCSFIPGAAPSTDAESGCHVALMSTWSSVLRTVVWGGIPVALPGIPVFAFLAFRGVDMFVRGFRDRTAATFLVVVAAIPVLTSIFFGSVAIFDLDAFCKTCAGIYASSAVAGLAAIGVMFGVWSESAAPTEPSDEPEPAVPPPDPAWLTLGVGFAELGAFVLVPVLLYPLIAPDHERYIGTCGELAELGKADEALVPIGKHRGGKPAIEVFDPLCPACRGFEKHLAASGFDEKLDRKALLFPLDTACNWMIGATLHPGACAVSEGILCAGDDAQQVIDWAFAHQEEIRTNAKADPASAEKAVDAAFPQVAKCTGTRATQQKLGRALRWAVANQLPVITPQLYVDGKKLCDDDIDLGLDFALTRMLGANP